MGRAGRFASRVVFGVALAALVSACGFDADTTANRARKALVSGDVETARALITDADAYSDDLETAVLRSFDLVGTSPTAFPSAVERIMREVDATHSLARDTERTAVQSYVSARQLRRSRDADAAADLAVERILAAYAGQGGQSPRSVPEAAILAALLGSSSPDPGVAENADALLTNLATPPVEQLTRSLGHADPRVRAAAIRYLSLTTPDGAAAVIADAVDAESDFVALYEAPLALARLPAAEAAPALIAMLGLRDDSSHVTPSGPVRAEAVAQLGRILRSTPTSRAKGVPAMLAALTDEHVYVRSRAAAVLVDMRGDAVPPLLDMAAQGWELARLPIVSLLVPEVEADARTELYGEVVRTLSALAEPTVMARRQRDRFVAGLAAAFVDPARHDHAVAALEGLGEHAAIALHPYLTASDLVVRARAASTLAVLGQNVSASKVEARMLTEADVEPLSAMINALAVLDGSLLASHAEELLTTAGGRLDVTEVVTGALEVAFEGGADPTLAIGASDTLGRVARSNSTRESLRRSAIRVLARMAPAGVELTLRDIMLDEHAAAMVRKSAAKALGSMGARASVALDAMVEILEIRREDEDDFLKRIRGRHGSEEKLNAAWAQMGWRTGYGNFREVKVIPGMLRAEVARAYAGLRGSNAETLLAAVLRDDQSASVRAAAASRLAGVASQAPALVRALRRDKSGTVRAAAALALVDTPAPRAEKVMLRALRRDDYGLARQYAARGLGARGTESAARGLAALLLAIPKEDADRLSRPLADEITDALIALGHVAVAHVLDGMDHPHADARHNVGRVLAESSDGEARAALRRAVAFDTSPRVRVGAAAALGQHATDDDVTALLAVLADTDEWSAVRAAAAMSLGDAGRLSSADALMAHLHATQPAVRAGAASSLGELGADQAVAALGAMALDGAELASVRLAAVGALGMLGGGAEGALYDLAVTEIGAVREGAVSALAMLDSPRATETLRVIAASTFEPDALRALAAFGGLATTGPAPAPSESD